MRQLHDTIREYTSTDKEYKKYIDSLKNSVLTAFYTPTEVVQSISQALAAAEITPKTLLDPSAGTGVFADQFGHQSPQTEVVCFEKDLMTGKILSRLQAAHTNESIVITDPFQKIEQSYDGYFDVVASNIPFGDTKVYDPVFERSDDPVRKMAQTGVHNYFFLKGIDTLREGGVLAFITSQGVLDSVRNQEIRQ